MADEERPRKRAKRGSPHNEYAFGTPAQKRRALMSQAKGRLAVDVTEAEASFLTETYAEIQKRADREGIGFRPSSAVEVLRRQKLARGDPELANLRVENTYFTPNEYTPYGLQDSFMSEGYARADQQTMEALARNFVAKGYLPPDAETSFAPPSVAGETYTASELGRPPLAPVMDVISGRRLRGRKRRRGKNLFEVSRPDVTKEIDGSVLPFDDKFNSAGDSQDTLSLKQAKKYLQLAKTSGAVTDKASVNDLLLLDQQ